MKWCVILMCALSSLFYACSDSDKSTSQNDVIGDELPDDPDLDSLSQNDTLSVKDSLDNGDSLAKEEKVPTGMLSMKSKGDRCSGIHEGQVQLRFLDFEKRSDLR